MKLLTSREWYQIAIKIFQLCIAFVMYELQGAASDSTDKTLFAAIKSLIILPEQNVLQLNG